MFTILTRGRRKTVRIQSIKRLVVKDVGLGVKVMCTALIRGRRKTVRIQSTKRLVVKDVRLGVKVMRREHVRAYVAREIVA